MDQLNFIIPQGSTPRIEMGLPFELPDGSTAYATFSQADRSVLEYAYNGTATPSIAGTGSLTRDADDKSLLILAMSQADTLGLKPGDAELQIRVKTTISGESFADTFASIPGVIVKAHKLGVIS